MARGRGGTPLAAGFGAGRSHARPSGPSGRGRAWPAATRSGPV